MNRTSAFTPSVAWLCLGAILFSVGCAGAYRDEKFRFSIAHTEHYAPARVVEAVRQTVQALNLKEVVIKTTNIDGQFWVRSALGDEYKIIVQGIRTDKTLVEVYTESRKTADQARLIVTEIRSRVARYVPEPEKNKNNTHRTH